MKARKGGLVSQWIGVILLWSSIMGSVVFLIGCATTGVNVTTIAPDGSSEEVSLTARTFFGDIKEATQAATIEVEDTGAYSVDTGQISKGLDSTALAESVVGAVGSAVRTIAGMPPDTIKAFRGPSNEPTNLPDTDTRLGDLERILGQLVTNLGMTPPE